MFLLRLLLKNAFRHRLRTGLTLVGLVVALCAFGLLRTIVDAWYAGANASSSTRLVTRHAVSLTFQLPLNYAERLRGIDGVTGVSYANWFGGVYITERNFFPQFAIEPTSYLALYPEYRLDEAERREFLRDRLGVIVGRKLARRFGWQVGDTIPLRGTIYPGTWNFTLRGIYDGAEASTDENLMFLRWDYLAESLRKLSPTRADYAGVFILGIAHPNDAAAIAQRVDAQFRNSLAETLTETEKAFQLGFVSMSETLLLAIQAVSSIVIVIIMVVMANTMTMTARERLAEYATLKALGFPPGFVVRLLFGESLLIALIGVAVALLLTPVLADAFGAATGGLLPTLHVSGLTTALQIASAAVVGMVAAAWPAWKMSRIDIVAGLRHVG